MLPMGTVPDESGGNGCAQTVLSNPTCVEAATATVTADATACQNVADLVTPAACKSVMQEADSTTAACTYTPPAIKVEPMAATAPSCDLKCESNLIPESGSQVGYSDGPPYFGDGRTTITCSGGGGDPTTNVALQAPGCIVRATCGNAGGITDGEQKRTVTDADCATHTYMTEYVGPRTQAYSHVT